MPPRSVKKKQTRLAFAPSAAAPSHEADPEETSRYATLTYNNGRSGTTNTKKPVETIRQALPKKKQPLSSTTQQSSSTSRKNNKLPTQDTPINDSSDESIFSVDLKRMLRRSPAQTDEPDERERERGPQPKPERGRGRGPQPKPERGRGREREPQPNPERGPQPELEPGPGREPQPNPEPGPQPGSQPNPERGPQPESQPELEPGPQPGPGPGPGPGPQSPSPSQPPSQSQSQSEPEPEPDTINISPKPSKMPRAKKFQQALRFAPKGAADTDPEELTKPRRAPKRKATSPIIVSDDDEPVVASARKRTKPAQLARTSPSLSSEDENEIVAPSTARKRRTRNPVDVKESDDSDQPVASSPMKRLRRGPEIDNAQIPHTPRHTSKQSKLDIEEDLVDLQDSVVKNTRTRGRNVETARDKRLKQLEVLRRRRAGLKEQSEDDAEDDAEGTSGSDVEEVTGRASPSGQGLWKHHDEDSDVESTIDPNEDLDRYEDDFVLKDDKDDLGVPTEEIPFEFTRHAYKQPKEYFRDVIGWMVHNKLNPAFPRSDAMYEMAFMKLEDEVKGRAGSQLISSVWTPGFVYSLQARPHMDISAYPTEENHSCDACRRSGHPASADMRLFGKPYSLQTLEPLNDDDDSDSNDDSNKSTNDGNDRDRNGHVIPDEHVHFYLGKQCKSRAVLAHTLTHWRHHLNEWVIDHLDRIGLMDDDEVLKRNNLSIKRRTRHANQVLDRMVFTGEVDKLWRDFHLNLKSAREKESIYG